MIRARGNAPPVRQPRRRGPLSGGPGIWLVRLLAAAVLLAPTLVTGQQLTNDEQAAQVLASARRGYQEGNYGFAIDRFREFLNRFGGHKDTLSARYGLGLALIEGPREYPAAIESLRQAAETQEFADRPLALYHLGLAERALGRAELAQALHKPQELPQRRQAAQPRFEQAAACFAAAATAFAARGKLAEEAAPSDPGESKVAPSNVGAGKAKALPLDAEWQVRARCDQAEMLLELGKFTEARALVDEIASNPVLSRTRYRETVLYLQGYAAYALHDYLAAGRALGELVPLDNPALGLHARYLLGRIHHMADERAAAETQYAAVLSGYEEQKKTAGQQLQNTLQLRDNPAERQRLEALERNPPPDYIARAWFYTAVLQYEHGKYAEAQERFARFRQQFQNHALDREAQYRQGACQVQLRQFGDAARNLQPFVDDAALADQALLWLARASIASADVANPQQYEQSLRTGCDFLRRAVEKAGARAGAEPAARQRRGDLLLELGDTQQTLKLYREAAGTYEQLLGENNSPDRVEETLVRRATALHLAGQYAESDALCEKFLAAHPRSPLLAAVLFRHAENAFLLANTAVDNAPQANRAAEAERRYGEVIARYQVVVDKYPEFESVAVAQQGVALCKYRLGQYEEAAELLSAIPESDRSGELAIAPYVLADCLLRTLPNDAADALAAARLMQQLDEAIRLLVGYLATNPKSPQVPDALLKLGYCYQQTAGIIVEPQERGLALQNARQTYEKVLQQFGNHPAMPFAVFERAKVLEQSNDLGGASNELNRFAHDPLSKSPIAPLALIRLSVLQRQQKHAQEAANLLAQARNQHESALAADPARKDWIAALEYHHALALKDAGKLPEARQLLEQITQKFADRPEAVDAGWRAGQCRKEEALVKLDAARKVLDQRDAPADQKLTAAQQRDDAGHALSAAAVYLHERAALAAKQSAGSDGHLRLVYEAAWCNRLAGQAQLDAARQTLEAQALAALQERAKNAAAGQTPPVVRAPEILLAKIEKQPGELAARDEYQALLMAGADSPLAIDARLELAEMLADRDELQPAIELLGAAMEKEPTPELADRIQLRLANCYLAIDDLPEALRRFEVLAKDEKHPLAAEARSRAGECYFRQQDWSRAVERWLPFRDQGPLQNLPVISEWSLLRLGEAQAQLKQWDASRQTFETLIGRFGQSRWVDEARYGMGWAQQNQNQFDQAVDSYRQVVNRTGAQVAARAQLQIGLCRMEQKRYQEAAPALVAVATTYDEPELAATARYEAALCYDELKQPDAARHLLEQVLAEAPDGRWAELARKRLAEAP